MMVEFLSGTEKKLAGFNQVQCGLWALLGESGEVADDGTFQLQHEMIGWLIERKDTWDFLTTNAVGGAFELHGSGYVLKIGLSLCYMFEQFCGVGYWSVFCLD